jgi:hypothetical protein
MVEAEDAAEAPGAAYPGEPEPAFALSQGGSSR